MKQRLMSGLALVGVSALLVGCSTGGDGSAENAGPTLESMEPVVLTVTDPNLETASNVKAMNRFMDVVRERTGGKVDFDTYWGGTLHPGLEGLSALQSGLADITFLSASYFADQLPAFSWGQGMGTLAISSYPGDMLGGSGSYQAMTESSSAIRDEFAASGAVPLVAWSSMPQSLICTKPFASLEEAQGMRARTAGTPFSDDVESIGLTNVFLENAELFEGLQRGIVDCVMSNTSVFMNAGLWEVAKYWIPLEFQPASGVGYMINKGIWDDFPQEVRQIMHEAKADLISDFLRNVADQNARWVTEAPGMGVEFVDAASLAPVLKAEQAQRVADLAAAAPTSMTEADEVIDRFERDMQNWNGILEDRLDVRANGGSLEELVAAYAATSSDNFDWAAYTSALKEFLAQFEV